jgi:beta-lactamase class A
MIFNKPEKEEKETLIKRVQRSKTEVIKKRKKEPPKPWGKKERLIIFFVLFFTIVTSGVLALSSREWKLPGLPRIKLPTISLFKEETIVFENENKKTYSAEFIEKSKKVIDDFKNSTNDLSGVYGLYVIDLSHGFSFGITEKETFQAASLIKLPVMIAMFSEAEKGNLDLETTYTLKDSDKISGSGSLYSTPAGTKISYQRLLELMGKQSDNTAYGIVRKIVGDTKINEVINQIGMDSTSLERNETSPYDIGIFFAKLWEGELISSKNSQKFLEYLTETSYEAWIAEGIPGDIRVAHKYGREIHVVNDAGIIFSEKPFVLVILTKGVVEREADDIFPDLARIVYSELK